MDKDIPIEERGSDKLLEHFAENYLADALRIISTRSAKIEDTELIYEAICIATSLYMRKLKKGEIHQDRTIH